MELQGKIVVIVGGSQGFGKALAKLFIKEEAKVFLVSKNKDSVEKTAQEIGAISFVADVRNEQEFRDISESIIKEFGQIDVWINSAGVFKKFSKDENIDMDRAHELFDVNFFGSVFGSRLALANMKTGIIINMLSSAALDASRAIGAELYASSKYALRGFVEAIRAENKNSAIKILSVYPGGMKTHLHDESIPEDFENFMDPLIVAEKVISNIKLENPEEDLIIKRKMKL